MLFEKRDKSSALNYAQYDALDLQNGDRIAICEVISPYLFATIDFFASSYR